MHKHYCGRTRQDKMNNRNLLLNPLTNRFVLKTGKIGKKILDNILKQSDEQENKY